MWTVNATFHFGLLCGDYVQAIKVAAFQWGIKMEHVKGPGWLSANHYFKFSHENKDYLVKFQDAIYDWLRKANKG